MFARRLISFAVSGGLILIAASLYLRPAWESDANIPIALRKVTPLGSSMGDVRSLAESRGWIQQGVRTDSYTAFGTGTGIKVTAFSGRLRQDPFPYCTAVAATWKFNRSNQLVNISVRRHE